MSNKFYNWKDKISLIDACKQLIIILPPPPLLGEWGYREGDSSGWQGRRSIAHCRGQTHSGASEGVPVQKVCKKLWEEMRNMAL